MSTESRADRIAGNLGSSGADDLSKEELEATNRAVAEIIVDDENEQFWYLYRALADASQSDVKDLVAPTADTSQSTVSRVIRDKEDAVLHDKEALSTVHGSLHEEDVELYPEEWLEAYKQVIADAQADRKALSLISSPDAQTPEWAARRFPELVGCHHQKAKKLPGDVDIADDSHLNRLDSVNTERWK